MGHKLLPYIGGLYVQFRMCYIQKGTSYFPIMYKNKIGSELRDDES